MYEGHENEKGNVYEIDTSTTSFLSFYIFVSVLFPLSVSFVAAIIVGFLGFLGKQEMVPTSSAAPAGHRRISSFRTSTFNFFKGNNNKNSHHHSGTIRRNELTISSPLPYTEEGVSPTTATPPSRADTEPIISERVSHRHKFPAAAGVYEIGPGRGAVQAITRRGSSVVDEEEHGDGSITVGMDLRDLSPSRQTQNNTESSIDDRKVAVPSAKSKTKGAKLKMALSLLRRRSNTNLRRAFVDPVDERYEVNDEREPFIVSVCGQIARYGANALQS